VAGLPEPWAEMPTFSGGNALDDAENRVKSRRILRFEQLTSMELKLPCDVRADKSTK